MRKRIGHLLFPMILLISCAAYRPIVDTRGIDRNRLDADIAECDEIAEQASPTTKTLLSTLFGAGIGGAAGAILGWVLGEPLGTSAAQGAAAGAVIAGASSGASNVQEYEDIMQSCLQHRGYTVLK